MIKIADKANFQSINDTDINNTNKKQY